MKLNNSALQELYETIVNGTFTFSPYADSPIDKAFKKCDEKIQKDIDIWKCGNEILLSANADLVNYKQKLEKDLDDAKSSVQYFRASRNDMERRAKLAEEVLHTTEEVRDNIRAELESKVKRMDEITKDLVDAKIQIKYFKESRDDWQSRVNNAEEEIEELKEELKESQKDYDELASQYQKLTIENKRLQDGLREIGYEQGQTDLWDMLQNVNDSQPYDFDAECDGMEDVISMDLEDFLDIYKKWQEERKKVVEEAKKKRVEYMRSYLKRYCIGRLCFNCPLHDAYKSVTSCMFSRLTDEEVEERYRKVIESNNKNIPTPISAWPHKSWECSIEAKVEINEDILKVVCGIKPDDKK